MTFTIRFPSWLRPAVAESARGPRGIDDEPASFHPAWVHAGWRCGENQSANHNAGTTCTGTGGSATQVFVSGTACHPTPPIAGVWPADNWGINPPVVA